MTAAARLALVGPTALTIDDLDELRAAVEAFTVRLRSEPLREFYARPRDGHPPQDPAKAYFATAIARLHAAHVLLFHIGQIDRPPAGRVDAGTTVKQQYQDVLDQHLGPAVTMAGPAAHRAVAQRARRGASRTGRPQRCRGSRRK